MIKVFVCAGMRLARNEKINEQARLLGEVLARNTDVIYVQGGSDLGLMGETLKAFIKDGKNYNRVGFFIPDEYYDWDAPGLIRLLGEENFKAIRVKGESGRLQKIIKCDHIIVLPGGTGTLEELMFCNETLRSNEHSAKVTVVNIDGYYDNFIKQINTCIEQGLSKDAIHFEVVNSVNEIDLENRLEYCY
jgi:predicted Rossmann-fold nucleotide-binding protein